MYSAVYIHERLCYSINSITNMVNGE
ncbi:hypothetical protein PP427_gp259 [Salmonella phage KM16]|nr:hypothetical protein PP427_gp259 [Salmonella phage KM16]